MLSIQKFSKNLHAIISVISLLAIPTGMLTYYFAEQKILNQMDYSLKGDIRTLENVVFYDQKINDFRYKQIASEFEDVVYELQLINEKMDDDYTE